VVPAEEKEEIDIQKVRGVYDNSKSSDLYRVALVTFSYWDKEALLEHSEEFLAIN
jgi:hypothetical protein